MKKLTMLMLGLLIIMASLLGSQNPVNQAENKLAANQLIRFHVIAHSDSHADQELKYRVRDVVIDTMEPTFAQATDIGEVRQLLKEKLPQIETIVADTVVESGANYPVSVQLGYFAFPTKSYGQFTLPAGGYEAVRIVIGDGQGANWWCVLFPPLCFVNIANGLVDNQELVPSSVLETPPELSSPPAQMATAPQIRFKTLEWLKAYYHQQVAKQ